MACLVKLDAADAPEKTVVLVEGEKAFDALAAYGSEKYTAAHWVGGVTAADKADYAPLKDRLVILWPDAHAEGRDAMVKAGIMAAAAGAAALQLVDTAELPDKADAADVDAAVIKALLGAAEEWAPPPAVHVTNAAMAKGAHFTRDAEGLEAALLTLRLVLRSNVRGGRIEVRRQDHGSTEALAFETALGLDADPAGWAHFTEPAAGVVPESLRPQLRGRVGEAVQALRRVVPPFALGDDGGPGHRPGARILQVAPRLGWHGPAPHHIHGRTRRARHRA